MPSQHRILHGIRGQYQRVASCLITWGCLSLPFQNFADEVTAEWISTTSGNWEDGVNWKDGVVPVSGQTTQYNVIMKVPETNGFIQCALTKEMELSRLTLGNVLYVYSPDGLGKDFHIWNNFRWVGGALNGWASRYHLHGESVFEGNTYKWMSGCTLIIHDHARWIGGHLGLAGYGRVDIEAGALFEIQTGGLVGSAGSTDSSEIYNRGIIRMDAPGQVVRFYGIMHSTGTLDVRAGDLRFMWGCDGTGNFNIEPGARLIICGPSRWQGAIQTGGGELVLPDREQEIATNTTFSCPTRIGADLLGSGNLSLPNAIWTRGGMSGAGLSIIPAGGKLQVQVQNALLNRTFRNDGEMVFDKGASVFGYVAAPHTNTRNGIIRLSSASYLGNANALAGSLVNEGHILKDDGTAGGAALFAVLRNDGLIRSTAGCLSVGPNGTNTGTFEAQAPGSIELRGIELAESSILLGDGPVSLNQCNVRGVIDPRLDLSVSATTYYGTNVYKHNRLLASGWLRLPVSGQVDVSERLTLSGTLYGGFLRSLGLSELSFTSAEIRTGGQLSLLGESAFIQGLLSVIETNSTLVNAGVMHVRGESELRIGSGATFVNQGDWRVDRRLRNLGFLLTDTTCRIMATGMASNAPFGDGTFQISGAVQTTPGRLQVGPDARLVLSSLATTNSSIYIERSSLEVTSGFVSQNSRFILDQGIIAGSTGLSGSSAMFTGQGIINGPVTLLTLEATASVKTNDLTVNGALTVSGASATFRAALAQKDGRIVFPFLKTRGPATLNGKFELVAPFTPEGLATVAGPVTILEADQPITSVFSNAANGATLAAVTNSFRFRIYYGPDSPFGANKIVLAEFGTPFDLWRLNRFTAGELADPAISSPGADPDRNSFNNVAEFVLMIDPGNRGRDLPSIAPGVDGSTMIHLRKRKDIGGLQPTIGISRDLLKWQEAPLGSSPSWMELHRVFELPVYYDYIYRYPGSSSALFMKITVTGQY